jgi:2-polyprenyl-3-methyl-5-hydroxy-6-metoxy-1,4-benzoquinol methylase
MGDYAEVNRKKTAELVEQRRVKGVGPGIKKRHLNIVNVVSKFADKKKPLLEIGVREGFLFDHLKNHGYNNLYGVDISPEGIKRLHERGYKGHIADAAVDLKIGDRKFNTIIISHCLEHVPEPNKVVDNMYKALNKGGIVYVEVPRQPKEPVPTPWAHYYCFSSPEELLAFFPEDKWEMIYFDKEKVMKRVFRRK